MHSSKYSPEKKVLYSKKYESKVDSFITKTICSECHTKKITNLNVEMIVLDLRPAAMASSLEILILY